MKISNKKIINSNKEKELIYKIRDLYNNSYYDLWLNLNELYQLKLKQNSNYTLIELTKLVDIPYNTVNRLMSFRYATPHMQELVNSGKLTFNKCLEILERICLLKDEDKDRICDECSHFTLREITEYLRDNEIEIMRLRHEKEINNNWSLVAKVKLSVRKLQILLLQWNKLPNKGKEEIKDQLNTLERYIKEIL